MPAEQKEVFFGFHDSQETECVRCSERQHSLRSFSYLKGVCFWFLLLWHCLFCVAKLSESFFFSQFLLWTCTMGHIQLFVCCNILQYVNYVCAKKMSLPSVCVNLATCKCTILSRIIHGITSISIEFLIFVQYHTKTELQNRTVHDITLTL